MTFFKKQLYYLLFINSFFTINAQKELIYYGSPSTKGAELHIKKDTFELVLKQGKHFEFPTRRGRKALFIDEIGYEKEGFKVSGDYIKPAKDSITINFYRRNLDSDYKMYYLGFKVKGDKNFIYKNLGYETLFFNTQNIKPFDFSGYFSIKIPRVKEIQLLVKQGKKYHMDQFKLSKKTSNVYVDYRSVSNKEDTYSNSKLFVAEIYKNGKLDINSKTFSPEFKPSTHIKRTHSDSLFNWKTPSLLEKKFYKKLNNPKYVYNPVITISPSPRSEANKKHEFGSLKEAVAAVKASDNKILLVFNSLLNNNDAPFFYDIFDGIYDQRKLSYLSDYHYEKYFAYYIKPEDLKELSKYRTPNTTEVFALNNNLDVVYTENISTQNFYWKYNTLDEELSNKILTVSELLKFKQKLNSKKITAKDFLSLGNRRYHNIIKSSIIKREKTEDELRIESQIRIIGERKKKYRFNDTKIEYKHTKINYTEIRKSLDVLVEKHKKDTSIDLDYAKLALDFLSVNDFFEEISGEKGSYSPTKIYYEFCLYLSRFPIEKSKIENKFTKPYQNNQYYTILKILERPGTKKQHPKLVNSIFENLIKIKDFKFESIFHYYIFLFNQEKLSYKQFDKLINEIAPLEGNYKTQVKSFYSECKCPYINNLEYYLEILSNSMAWQAVTKNNNDKATLKKALKWAKLAVELSPESHYYKDTLAHLEYFLGNKKRAIELQSKAFKLATERESKDSTGYKKTLEKMKLNTLKY